MTRRFGFALGAIAVVALVVRVLYAVVVDPRVGELSDASAYHLLGENLADGRGYIRPFDFMLLGVERATAEYPPLFPAFLAALHRVGVTSVGAQQVVLAFVGTATVLLTGLVGRRVAGEGAGLVAAAIVAVHPMVFQADGILMTESLATALVTACVLLALRARGAPTLPNFLLLGAALGVATLGRSEGLVLAPLLVVPAAFAAGSQPVSRRIGLAATALATTALLLVPWTLHNLDRFDTFIPVSNNLGTVLDGANCDLTYHGAFLGSWRSEFAEGRASQFECFEGFAIEDPAFDEASAAAEARREGLDYVRDHTRRLPVVALARLGRTWGVYRPAQQVDLARLEGREEAFERAGTWLHWALLPLAAAGAVLLARRRRPLWPLLAPIVTVSLVSVATYGNQRFRITADPMLAVLAAVTVVELARRARHTATRAATAAVS
jgi:4-amino-4-deoxy-L-arabinose transferase-like glycosyltransferase